jgi:hypothetical protein
VGFAQPVNLSSILATEIIIDLPARHQTRKRNDTTFFME